VGERRVFERFGFRVVRLLLAAAAVVIFGLSFLVVADIIGRVVFSSPVKGTPEIVSMSIVIICFLLAGYAVQSGSMIRTDVLVAAAGPRGQKISAFASGVLGVAFFGLIVWGSYEPLLHAITSGEFEGEGALRVPAWPARLVILIGGFLVVLIYLGQAVAAARAIARGEGGKP
jgi:TRAP-type C4-dicarboxylate transport system permease small subunit